MTKKIPLVGLIKDHHVYPKNLVCLKGYQAFIGTAAVLAEDGFLQGRAKFIML